MSHLTDILSELTDAGHLIRLRPGNEKLASGVIASICAKIGTIQQWGPGPAHTMYERISNSGLSDDLRTQLNSAVDARLSLHVGSIVPIKPVVSHGAPTRDQCIRHLNSFLSSHDWSVIDDTSSTPPQRDNGLSKRLRRLGVRRASDDGCIRWAIVILVDAEYAQTGSWPSYRSIYNRVTRVSGHPIAQVRSSQLR